LITLYDSNELDFTNNGICILNDCIVAKIEEELNGIYSLYIEYPIFSKKAAFITHENIIKAPTPKGYQLFRVNSSVKSMGVLKIYANHIFFDLRDNIIEDTNIIMKNGLGAIEQMLTNTQYPHYFSGFSDIDSFKNARIVRKNPIEAILSDEDNSFVNRWGGELERDNFNIRLLNSIGRDRGVNIRYGKNLIGIEEDLQMNDVATRIMPLGAEGLMLPEKYIDSPLINNYTNPKITKIEFSSIKVNEQTTQEEAFQMLRDAVSQLYNVNKVDMPKVNYKVDFVELSKTEEYKKYAVLETVYIGDTVTVKHEKIGINIKAKVIKYKWNCLVNKYTDIELGNFKDNISGSISTLRKAISSINNTLDGMDISILEKAKENATELISNGLGGYVVKNRDEILIMDTDDVNTAQKVWRWNKNGLGYSSTGYNGIYGLAITADGAIVADFITTGKFNASLIKAGTIDAKKVTISNLIVGENVTMGPNAIISWEQISNPPNIPPPTTLPSYITSTKITSTTIEAPIISGGTISGGTVNVNTLLNIGNAYPGFSSSIQFKTGSSTYALLGGYYRTSDFKSFIKTDAGLITAGNVECGGNVSAYSVENGWGEMACGNIRINGTIYASSPPWAVSSHTHTGVYAAYLHSHSEYASSGHSHTYFGSSLSFGSVNGAMTCTYLGSTGNIAAQGSLTVSGSKNSLQDTENYGKRLINAYETAEYYFGDIGCGIIGSDGECAIHLDEIFQECANLNIPYHVFIQLYNGSITSIDRQAGYFIVYGEAGTEFSWEIKAKRKGYEHHRLEIFEGENPVEYSNIETELDLNSNLEDELLEV
jgi:phage minor structural protein